MSECNIDPREVGQLTRREIEQLKRGAEKYSEKKERKMNSNSSNPTRASKLKREEQALQKYANG